MKIIIATLSILFFITSCSEEKKRMNDKKIEHEQSRNNMNNFKSFLLYPKKQILHIAENSDTLVLTSGNKLIVTPAKFISDKKIEVIEFTTLSSMILSNLTTMSNGSILCTKGMLNIQTKDSIKNIELVLKDSIVKNEYLLFYGNKNENNINWTPEKHVRNEYTDEEGNLLRVTYSVQSFFIRKMGWVNVDKFLYCKEKKDLIVNLSEKEKIMYYLILPEYNSILPAVFDKERNLTFKDIPICNSLLVGISYDNSIIKFKYQDIKADKKTYSFPKLEIVTEEELNNSLAKLDEQW